ncbi:c-type cytochrome [Denitratisoma oestradiolicum]|uniref:Class I cytochrome c n=1 Tax=Denitratisoma oestradiolicum TaxID=311182 RepID=A0A6S6XXY2_9PROT|nr:cytochrome c [Denitratisoma oestradiolicum]TWO78715.1 hypothetical protein CBW56_18640 [Denitratisoma oestradiolicum]CAB1369856.1 Class I cytochrome c [Denitratisoma oestradiolicum]
MQVNLHWLCFCVLTVSLTGTGSWAHAATSVKNGVFSQAQAKRGQGVIIEACASCHSISLLGGEGNTPPLVGDGFQNKWNGLTLKDLFQKAYSTMPPESPGRLSKSDYVDALAFILSSNKYPPGDKDLSSNLEALGQIKIEPYQ